MFGLSVEHLLLLLVAGLFILGPERLPESARWLAQTVRKIQGTEQIRHRNIGHSCLRLLGSWPKELVRPSAMESSPCYPRRKRYHRRGSGSSRSFRSRPRHFRYADGKRADDPAVLSDNLYVIHTGIGWNRQPTALFSASGPPAGGG